MLKLQVNRFSILLLAELLVLVILLAGCLGKEQLCASFTPDALSVAGAAAETNFERHSERLTLTPGIYEIRVKSVLTEGQQIYTTMNYRTAPFQAICTNGLTLLPANMEDSFYLYVTGSVTDAYITCHFTNAASEALLQLDLYRTNLDARILLFFCVLLFAAVDFMICFHQRIQSGCVTAGQQLAFWAMAGGILLAYFPYMTDYIFLGEDTAFHLSRIASLKGTLLQGLSVPAMLMALGLPLMTAYKLFVLLSITATAVTTFFSLKRCMKDDILAVFGSLTWLLSPCYLDCIYREGAVGEFTAFTFVPLILSSLYLYCMDEHAFRHTSTHKWYLLAGLAGVWLSHLQTAAVMTLLTLVIVICCRIRPMQTAVRRLQTFVRNLPMLTLRSVLGAILAITALISTYRSNELIFEAVPYYLYNGQDISTQTQNYHLPTAELLAPVCLLLLLILHLIRYRKEAKHI